MSYRLGIDVGGTFTDFLCLGGDSPLVHKTSSTTPIRRSPSSAGWRRSPGGSGCRSRTSWRRSS